MSSEATFQSLVRDAVLELTSCDDDLRVTHTQATLGWGRVLFVDVYTRPGSGSREELDGNLRKAVSLVADHPLDRVAIRWRLST